MLVQYHAYSKPKMQQGHHHEINYLKIALATKKDIFSQSCF